MHPQKNKMKKSTILLLSTISALSFGQQNKVGINTKTPHATLEIQHYNPTSNTDTSVEGILIPRVSRLRAFQMGDKSKVKESTLIYIDNVSTGAKAGTMADVDTKGFYYFSTDLNKWVKLSTSSQSSFVDTNTHIYNSNGTLQGERTVNHNNHYLTFKTGTGKVVVEGKTLIKGEFYRVASNITTEAQRNYYVKSSTATEYGDHVIINKLSHGVTNIYLPTTPENMYEGRELCIINVGGGSVTIHNLSIGENQNNTLAPNLATCILSTGQKWVMTSKY